MRIFVFYAGLLYGEYDSKSFRLLQVRSDCELYNGAYVFRTNLTKHPDRPWYRMDGTPCLLADVPKELQMSVLLLT